MTRYVEDFVLMDVRQELWRAQRTFGPMVSAHEGYAILLEEVQELWEEIRKQPNDRELDAMRAEAIQVAAMAVRFVMDVCDE